MLNSYLQRIQQRLSDTKQVALNPVFLTQFVNSARGQVAAEAECIRVIATIPTVIGQRNYNFSSLNLGAAPAGVLQVIHVRRLNYSIVSGQSWMRPRNWEWFDLYKMNDVVPASGPPKLWAQYAQGTAGSFYIDPLPDLVYTLNADTVCQPIDLVNDTTPEAIPYPWTDAVPYFGAYLSYLSQQEAGDAKAMLDLYETFMKRARQFANPSVNRYLYQQADDPTRINKLGLQRREA